jgi:hypothetical protein
MPRHSLENVRLQLLRAGISPGQVNRYVRELRDHLSDLIARERAAGLSASDAEAKAVALLGTDTQLVQAMLDRGPPRSLAAKAPWATFGVLPLVIFIVVTALLARLSLALLFPYSALPAADIPGSVRTIGTTLSLFGSYAIGPLLAAVCILIALRQRLSSPWVWAGLALIALVSGPLGLHIQFLSPDGDAPGGIHGSVVAAGGLPMIGLRATVLFVLSALAYGVLKQRVENSHV